MPRFEVHFFGRPVCRLGTVSILKNLKSVQNSNIRITRYITAEKEAKEQERRLPYITLPEFYVLLTVHPRTISQIKSYS